MLHIKHARKHFIINGSAINVLIDYKVIECCANIKLNLTHTKGYNFFMMLVKKRHMLFYAQYCQFNSLKCTQRILTAEGSNQHDHLMRFHVLAMFDSVINNDE